MAEEKQRLSCLCDSGGRAAAAAASAAGGGGDDDGGDGGDAEVVAMVVGIVEMVIKMTTVKVEGS